MLADLFRFFAGTYTRRHDHMVGAALHDPLAVLALTHRELFTSSERHVAVETHGELTRGMTVIDRRDLKERPAPNCTVLESVDSDAAWRLIVDAITRASGVSPDTFPRQYARTRRFTLGEPRDLVISRDGERLVFARSRGGSDPVNCLWVADLANGGEQLVADPDRAARRRRRQTTCRQRSAPGVSAPARRPAVSPPSPPTPT